MNPLIKVYANVKESFREKAFDKTFNNYGDPDRYLKANPDCPQLTAEDIRKIDEYWAQYGIKWKDYNDFRMYYNMTGVRDPRFIPGALVVYCITPYYNDPSKWSVLSDKNLFERLMPGMRFPTRLGWRVRGRYHDADGKDCGDTVTMEFAEKIWQGIQKSPDPTSMIVKQSQDSSHGDGVKKYFVSSAQDVFNALKEWTYPEIIIQATVIQNDYFAKLNKDSVNIMRWITWRHDGEIKIFSTSIRIGTPGCATDVGMKDGVRYCDTVKIDENGYMDNLGWHGNGEIRTLDVPKEQVPSWEKIKELVIKNHASMEYCDYIGWDMTVDNNGDVICIEYNIRGPGAQVYQLCHRKPISGEYTDEFLAFLKDPENQKKYLPKSIRIH